MYVQDWYYNYDIKKASGNNGINRCNIGKYLDETNILTKTMKRMQYIWKTWLRK